MRGRQFTDRVTEQEPRCQAAVLGVPEEGDLDGEQGGLGELGTVQERRLVGTFRREQHVPQRPSQPRVQARAHLVQGGGVLRGRPVQLGGHAGALAALPGEDERERARGDRAAHEVRAGCAVGEPGETGGHVLPVRGEQYRAPGERGTGGGQRVGDVAQGEAGVRVEVVPQLACLGAQRLFVAARDEQRGRCPGGPDPGRGRPSGGVVPRGFGEHHVAVGAAHAEGAHAHDQRPCLLRPGCECRVDADAELRHGDGRVRGRVVQGRRDLPVAHGQYGLEEAGDTGGAFEVADVRLDGADQQRLPGRTPGAENGPDGGGLDGIAGGGSGAVQLHIADGGRGDSGLFVRGGQHRFLAGAVRDGQPLAAAVVVHRAAREDAVDVVAVGDRVGERLEYDDATALAAHIAVGPRVEGVAVPVRGERPEPFHGDGGVLGKDQVHPARQGHGALAPAQALGRQMHRDQRRRLSRVHGEARSAQAQRVGDAVGDDAPVQTGRRLRGGGVGAGGAGQRGVVVGDGAHEDPGAAAAEAGGRDPGVLERLPAQLKDQPLLRVHRRGLARGDPEEAGVELVDGVEESAPPWRVPPVPGSGTDGVLAISEESQELGRSRRTRQPARHSHHRYRLNGSRPEFSGLCLGPTRHVFPLPH
ncbi:hypothetical protein Save01_02235 [Streptomyces avermitilis]